MPWSSFAISRHVRAPHIVVYEYGTRTILFERDIDTPTSAASMSKLMTLYIVFQHLKAGKLSLDDSLKVSANAVRAGPPSAFFEEGQMVKVHDLIMGTAVASGNDASITLAEGLYNSQEAFVDEMNKVAQELHLTNSTFKNATGWPNLNSMSVRDMLTLAVRMLQDFPEYYYFFGEKQFSYNGKTQKNYNALLNYNNIMVDGIKTGHTPSGDYGMIASAHRDNRRVLVVINGLKTELARAYETKKLILYGFNKFDIQTIFHAGSTVGTIPIQKHAFVKLPVLVTQDVIVSHPKDFRHEVKAFISPKSDLDVPVKKGEEVGTLLVKSGTLSEYTVPVYALKGISKPCRICDHLMSLYHKVRSLFAPDQATT
ncbi:D-alanyl-D-alanine carboxypeptidase family protein [Anaplasma platys]|nr:D-alanyl-D-alanine carboxypeptidase family protein [Anaplasma platys]